MIIFQVEGDPQPMVSWYKDGRDLAGKTINSFTIWLRNRLIAAGLEPVNLELFLFDNYRKLSVIRCDN